MYKRGGIGPLPLLLQTFSQLAYLREQTVRGMSFDGEQCVQKKIAKFLFKLPKNDFTRKMIDFDTPTKFA